VLMELGEGGVVGKDWLMGGLEGEEAHECTNGQGSMIAFERAVVGWGLRFVLCTNAHLRRKVRAEDGAPGLLVLQANVLVRLGGVGVTHPTNPSTSSFGDHGAPFDVAQGSASLPFLAG
jgi:hypothetical protein